MSERNKSKRKLETKTLVEKCKILREIEKGMSNKDAAKKFKVPKTRSLPGRKIQTNYLMH